MIYAKTNMEEMPVGCSRCDLRRIDTFGDMTCSVVRNVCRPPRNSSGNIQPARPDWCPLVEKTEKEDPNV